MTLSTSRYKSHYKETRDSRRLSRQSRAAAHDRASRKQNPLTTSLGGGATANPEIRPITLARLLRRSPAPVGAGSDLCVCLAPRNQLFGVVEGKV